jgi:hypothetical protein
MDGNEKTKLRLQKMHTNQKLKHLIEKDNTTCENNVEWQKLAVVSKNAKN